MKNKMLNKLCFITRTTTYPKVPPEMVENDANLEKAFDLYDNYIHLGKSDQEARLLVVQEHPEYKDYMGYEHPWNNENLEEISVTAKKPVKPPKLKLPKPAEWPEGYEWLDKALPAAGTMMGGIIGGGMVSTAGNIVGGLGDLAAMVPGPVGAAGSAILKAGSGLVNRAFGSKMNDANVAKVENNIKAMNSFTTNASSYDLLASNARNATLGMTFNNSFIGSDGWFSNKAKNKANSLRKQVAAGNNFVLNSLINNANNIGKTQMLNLLANYAAYGGPIDGAIGYNFMLQSLLNDLLKINNLINRITSMPNSFINNEFALGGLRNGGYFSNGLTYIGEGGTHEQNPHEGVLMGYDEEGTPNLVEEGEYVWNDYVFSNRMRLPKNLNKIFKLGNKKGGYTFAEAVDFILKESEERPNDPISARGLNLQLMKLAMVQEELRMQKAQLEQEVNKFEFGGPIMGDDGKESDWFKENVIDWFNEDPYGRMYQYLKMQNHNYLIGKRYDALNWALEKKDLAPYIKGEKSLDELTDKEAESIIAKFSDGKYVKGSYHDIFGAWPELMENDNAEYYKTLYPTIKEGGVPIKIQKIDPKTGNVTSTPFTWGDNGEGLIYTGHKYGFKDWLNKKDPETNTSIAERLTAMGYDISKLDLEELDGDYYLNLLDKKGKLAEKAPSIYKALVPGTEGDFEVVDDPTLFMENPRYKGYTQTKEVIDKDGNRVYYYEPSKDNWGQKSVLQALRYTPILGNLGQVVLDKTGVTNKPIYEQAEAIGAIADNLTEVAVTPLGNYLTYKPTDKNLYLNLLYANTAAANRGIINLAGLNRGTATAGLLASNYNTNNATGNLLTKLNLADFDRQKLAAEFNRGTDLYNSTAFLDAAKANQTRDQLRLQAITNEAKLKTEERLLADTAKAANMSNLFESMSALGKEIAFEDMIKNNRALTYGTYGQIKDINGNYINSLGGYLTIKKRR